MYVRGELSDQWSETSTPPRLILESGEKLENIRFSLGQPLQTDSTILHLKIPPTLGRGKDFCLFFDTFAFVGLNSTFSTVYLKLSKVNETGLILLCVL